MLKLEQSCYFNLQIINNRQWYQRLGVLKRPEEKFSHLVGPRGDEAVILFPSCLKHCEIRQ